MTEYRKTLLDPTWIWTLRPAFGIFSGPVGLGNCLVYGFGDAEIGMP